MSVIEKLESLSFSELKKIAEKMDIIPKKSKKDTIIQLNEAFSEYLEYKRKKIDKYEKKEKLGEGKEGTTYLVVDKKGRKFAMKTFRSAKSSNSLRREYNLQKKAASVGISPEVYDYDTVSKYIVMERMDGHLYDLAINKQKKRLKKNQQLRIIEIFDKLDSIKVFHDDANLANYMYRGDTLYIIDFGFGKEITPSLVKKLKTDRPNGTLMIIGLILKLKEENFDSYSYKYLQKRLTEEERKRYGI